MSDIDVSTITLDETIRSESTLAYVCDHKCDAISSLMVKFDRQSVQELILANRDATGKLGATALVVCGALHDGTSFEGSDTIRTLVQDQRTRWRRP